MQAVAIVSSADLRRIYGGFAAYLTVFCKMELSDLDRIDRLFLGKTAILSDLPPETPNGIYARFWYPLPLQAVEVFENTTHFILYKRYLFFS